MKERSGPQFLRFIIPIIEILRERGGAERSTVVADLVIKKLHIPERELYEQLPSGGSRVMNQIRFARLYLARARFLAYSERGVWKLSKKGLTTPLSDDTMWEIYHEVQKLYRERPQIRPVIPTFEKRITRASAPITNVLTFGLSQKAAPPPKPGKDPGGKVKLFYGTNRNITGKSNPNKRYGNERGELVYGTCVVNIPPGHIRGQIERPKWWKLQFTERPDRDVMLTSLQELDPGSFFSEFRGSVKRAPEHDALLFIHGFKNSFAFAAQRSAQISYDLGFQGVSSFFSWPTKGLLSGYLHDLENSEWSVTHLEKFAEGLLCQTGVEKLHIIAHSMGNNLLSLTLRNLRDKAALAKSLKAIHQVILCAPDVDRGVFQMQRLPKMRKLAKRITMYASSKDAALRASDDARWELPRLGEAGEHLFVAQGMDTVDASNVKTDMLGHGYFSSTRELINDLHHVVCNELPPPKRNLSQRMLNNLPYWLFPETA